MMHSRGGIRCNNASLLQGLVVFPGSTGGGVDADEPDRREVIQRANLLLSTFQGHPWVFHRQFPRAKRVVALAAGTCDMWGCRWGGRLPWAVMQAHGSNRRQQCLVCGKASSRELQRSVLLAFVSLVITQMREEAAH